MANYTSQYTGTQIDTVIGNALLKSEAQSTYLSITNANTNFLTKTDANSTYLKITDSVKIAYGTVALDQMSNVSAVNTTWRYKDVTYSGFSTTPLVLITVDWISNGSYGSITTCVGNVTTTGARIYGCINLSTNVIRLNWLAIGT